jgi:hypothetical protein
MHLHGRALPILLPKIVDRVEDYEWVEGELMAGMVLGWNFGDGHLHDEQLLAAVQERCGYEPADVRVILLESQPIQHQWQHYRIVDAATGLVEEGRVRVEDMVRRQPWLDDEPSIEVTPIAPAVARPTNPGLELG